jgi:O-antigen ligase
MLFVIHRNRDKLYRGMSLSLLVFLLFWAVYILKVMINEGTYPDMNLSRPWEEYIIYSVTYVVAPFITYYTLDFKKFKETILNAIIASGFILGIISIYLYGSYLGQDLGRLSMIYYITGDQVLSPLALSYSGALTIVLCAHKLLILKNNSKATIIYLMATIVLSFIMFLLGSSRGSVIALMLTLPLFILYSQLKQRLWLMALFILATPVVIWAIEASGSSIFDRIANTSEDQGGGRAFLWKNAFSHFLENPIVGGQVEIGGIYPHNIFIEILMATGIVGAVMIIPLIFVGLRSGIYLVRNNKIYLFVLLILIQGLVQHFFTGGFYTATLVFVPLAIFLRLRSEENRPALH